MGMDAGLHRGDHWCIYSVFNQWIKLSIHWSIDVSYDNCLSVLSKETPEAFPSCASWWEHTEEEAGRHAWISNAGFTPTCSIIPLSRRRLKRTRSQSLYTELGREPLTWSPLYSGTQSIWTTIANSSIIAMTSVAPAPEEEQEPLSRHAASHTFCHVALCGIAV